MRGAPSRLFAVVALLLVLLAGGTIGSALAGEAAVVVRHGDGSITYALVVFDEEEISSLELLRRSELSLTTVSFGGLGEAVCTLDGEGCGVADCRVRLCQTGDRDSPFWQFFRMNAEGVWVSQPLGASASRVSDGLIDGWSWTGGEPHLPPLDLAQVAEAVHAPAERAFGAVYSASFDPDGVRITARNGEGNASTESIAGLIALVAISAVALALIRRRQAHVARGAGR